MRGGTFRSLARHCYAKVTLGARVMSWLCCLPPLLPQDSSGVSRDEMAAALLEVAEGRVPTDRIALRELFREMSAWPFLDKDAPTGDTGAAVGGLLPEGNAMSA